MVSYDNEDAIVVTEPTEIEVAPAEGTAEGSRGVSGPIINNAGGTSETPSNLVAEGNKPELSPNPAGFGFTKQRTVDELPEQGEPNTVYLLNVYNNGTHIGYRIFKWTPSDGYTQFGATPDLKLEKGAQEQKAIEVNAPKQAPEKVFTGEVVFLQEPTIKGKKLSEYIDSVGGVTEAELQAAVTELQNQINAKQDALTTTSVPEGTATRLIGFDSQGHPVNSPLPEGTVVVDTQLDDQSTNPVQNKVVTEKFNEVDEGLETKANVDGNYPTMTVGAADNLTPYDEDSGTDQEQPFLLQGTGCGNGEQQVDTGALGLLKEKQGNSVVVNQYGDPRTFTNEEGCSGTVANGKITITGTGTNNGPYIFKAKPGQANLSKCFEIINGHKYLILTDLSHTENYYVRWQVMYNNDASFTEWLVNQVVTADLDGWGSIWLWVAQDYEVNVTFTCYVFDLTQWFGSNDNIPSHLLSHPEDFFRYYQGSLAYNEGTLVNSNGRYLKTIGRNQWDEEWKNGGLNLTTGAEEGGANVISKNFIKVIPNQEYAFKQPSNTFTRPFFYDKDKNFISAPDLIFTIGDYTVITIPSNACYMKFEANYGTYANDITISIYYDGESGYDEYYPYEELANIDTGTETLRSAGSVKDSKAPDGKITRRIGVVDLGSLTWYFYEGKNCFSAVIDGMKILSNNEYQKMICPKYSLVTNRNYSNWQTAEDKSIFVSNSEQALIIRDTAYSDAVTFKTAMSGVYLFYELATPTTEQGTTFSENVAIDDFGSMEFGAANGVPQGASIFYAVDYKAFIDSLYNTLDGDATDIVKESELDTKLAALGYVKLTSVSGYDVTKTQVLKNVEGTLTWVTEE